MLDPCCGTGAYPIAVLEHIHNKLIQGGEDENRAATAVRNAIQRQVYGFEILPALFIIAHMQVSPKLAEYGAALSNRRDERAGIYLTNALVGWNVQADTETSKQLFLTGLARERDSADRVKQSQKNCSRTW